MLIVTVHWTRSFSQIPSLLQSSAFMTFQMIPVTLSTRFLRLYCRATQQSHLSSDREPKQGLPPCNMWPQDSRVLAPRFAQPSNSQPVPPSCTPDLFRAMSLSHFTLLSNQKKKKKGLQEADDSKTIPTARKRCCHRENKSS